MGISTSLVPPKYSIRNPRLFVETNKGAIENFRAMRHLKCQPFQQMMMFGKLTYSSFPVVPLMPMSLEIVRSCDLANGIP
jgi:hypothetical protein